VYITPITITNIYYLMPDFAKQISVAEIVSRLSIISFFKNDVKWLLTLRV